MKNKILVLGHRGMLGRTVFSYLGKSLPGCVYHIDNKFRWPSKEYKDEIEKYDWVINCVGSIPQKNPNTYDLFSVNTELPLYLLTTDKKVIHASTDCEYSGSIEKQYKYLISDQEDAKDDYGISKSIVTKFVKEYKPKNFIIIRSSLIGIEESSNFSLLNWACSKFKENQEINGFTNHYWNGITTLQWAKICLRIIEGEFKDRLFFQPCIETISKYELLNYIKNEFHKDSSSEIKKVLHSKYQNKSLEPNTKVPKIDIMLNELNQWNNDYKKISNLFY